MGNDLKDWEKERKYACVSVREREKRGGGGEREEEMRQINDKMRACPNMGIKHLYSGG